MMSGIVELVMIYLSVDLGGGKLKPVFPDLFEQQREK